jgi:hypothetical protein
MYSWSLNLIRGIILVPKLSNCIFRFSNLLIISHEVQIIIIKLKSESAQLMWNLHAGPNFILKFSIQLLIFYFFKILFQNFMPNIFFSNISSKICPFILYFFYKFVHTSFLFYNFFYRYFLFKYICTSKLV